MIFLDLAQTHTNKVRRSATLTGSSSDLRNHTYEWQYTYSNKRIIILLAMEIRIGFITSCRHINVFYAWYLGVSILFTPSEKKMLVFSFRKSSLSNRILRSCSAPELLMRKANLLPLREAYLRNAGSDQRNANRKREPCIGTYEHCHDPDIREDYHAETEYRPDDVRR